MILEVSQEGHRLWCAWVDGEIPGYPGDDEPLLAAQEAATRAICARYGVVV